MALQNEDGEYISPGVYYFVIRTNDKKKIFKLKVVP